MTHVLVRPSSGARSDQNLILDTVIQSIFEPALAFAINMGRSPRSSSITAFAVFLLASSLLLAAREVQGFAPTQRRHERRITTQSPPILLSSDARHGHYLITRTRTGAKTEGDDGEPELILGGGAGAAGGPTDYLSDFRAASAKRNEEAKKKLLEEAAREEEEARARQKAREEGTDDGPNESNYGPGDLSSLPTILTSDASWEASLGDTDDGVMGVEGGKDDDDEGPGLYVPGADDGDSPQLFIPSEGDGDGDSPIIL